jgi:hypothetical protein
LGKRVSSQNARKHGLSANAEMPIDHEFWTELVTDALSRGYSETAAKALASSVLQHQRVCRAYAEVYEKDCQEQGGPNLESRGRVQSLKAMDIVSALECLVSDEVRLTPRRAVILELLAEGAKSGDIISDTTTKTLLGLERYLRNSGARIAKAARMN